MSLRSALTRGVALAAATGALLAGAAAVPAGADDGKGNGTSVAAPPNGGPSGPGGGRGDRDPRRYQGVVTAQDGLWLHDRPDRSTRKVRFAEHGAKVSIYCKVKGSAVGGNPLWYLLTDGTWAWGSARYIANVGAAPRWC
ncbi:SH3 domain-containing protein [Streptomyces sp. NPDC003656]|uniref:SH3 domain-containing protein n=1 Tax=unclassified Streptomyces TaxID=2593676 RepID=UPI0018F4C83C|nr:SH3 domain-containing protein [Streptomyces sp. DSM 110735]MBJ7906537.1 SH3 domain-containing protein [Streptomyces sp. DSM 110735]